ncbi:PAS domain S-box protein [Terasakiella sp. SH-1]|uniref:PAS domain S-box protein n=1 Tax=Terasakiella sp. SH-1 TaxID=2560057 RepID=UPI001074315F|nr:PAS domain S-box protein [Terasakiella sp. SH-1]
MTSSSLQGLPIRVKILDEVSVAEATRWTARVLFKGEDQPSDILILLVEGRYKALPLLCPHGQASLLYAPLEGTRLTCTRHGRTFDLVGADSIAMDVLCDHENFYVLDTTSPEAVDSTALKEKVLSLEIELEAQRAANSALEEQVVSGMEEMDVMFSELESRKTEWKEKSHHLGKLNDLVTRVTDSMRDVIVIAGRNGRIQRVNKSAMSVFDCEEFDFIGRPVDDLLAAKDLERLSSQHYEKVAPDLPVLYQLCFAIQGFEQEVSLRFDIRSNGNAALAHPFLLRGTRLYDSHNKEEGAIFVFSDISGVKEREFRLRQKENEKALRLLEATLSNISHGIAVFDEDGELLVSNPAFVRITGCKQRWAVPGTPYEKFLALENERTNLCSLGPDERSLKSLQTSSRSWESYYQGGRVVDCQTNVMGGGRFALVSQDVTRLREDAEQMRLMSYALEQSPAEVIITDEDGVIEYVNAKFTENTGYTKEQAIGHRTNMVRSGQTPNEYYETLWQTVKQGKHWSGEVLNKRKDGSLFWQLLSIAPMYEPDGRMRRYLAIKENIDERKKAEEELARHRDHLQDLVSERTRELSVARDEAEKANKAKSEFLSSMSHELRTPLNGILGFAQLMEMSRKDPLSEMQREYISHILKAGQHLLGLINEVLDLAKIEAGKMPLSMEDTDLSSILEDSICLVGTMAEERHITLHNLTGEKPLRVHGDPVRLKQIVVNLLSNAVKYNREKGNVFIEAEQEDGVQTLSIRDTGYGISPDHMKDLFTPFNRLGVEGQNVEGSGIGLTITRKLVLMMEGDIQAESVEGEGSVFKVLLPIPAKEVKRQARALNQNIFSIQFNGKGPATPPLTAAVAEPVEQTILYAEDNPSNQFLIERAMTNLPNVALVTVNNAKLAVDYACKEQPNLILMDINLPGMDGYEAMKLLHSNAQTQAIPVIALSAKAQPCDVEQGLRAGFRAYITKPVNVADLLKTVRTVLEKEII